MSYKMLSYLQGEDDIGRVYNYRRPCVRPGLYGFLDLSYADNVIRDDLHLHMCSSSRTGRLHRTEALLLRDGIEKPFGAYGGRARKNYTFFQ